MIKVWQTSIFGDSSSSPQKRIIASPQKPLVNLSASPTVKVENFACLVWNIRHVGLLFGFSILQPFFGHVGATCCSLHFSALLRCIVFLLRFLPNWNFCGADFLEGIPPRARACAVFGVDLQFKGFSFLSVVGVSPYQTTTVPRNDFKEVLWIRGETRGQETCHKIEKYKKAASIVQYQILSLSCFGG